MPLSAESNWFQLTSASLLWVYGNDSTHELWYGICASITCQHVALLNLGISCVETSASGIKIPLWFDKSIGQSYQEPCQIYQNQKNMVQWANEEKTVPAGFGVSFSGKDAKCNKIISSLTEPWKPIRQSGQKKNNSPPGRPEENAVNQSSQEQKPQRTQPKLTHWTNFTSTSTTSTTTTTSSSRKESTPQSVGPSAKNHHPCQKAKQTPIWDPKQTAFRVLGNVASLRYVDCNWMYCI